MDSGDLEAAARLGEAMAALSTTAREVGARLAEAAGESAAVAVDQSSPPREDGLVERLLTAEDLAEMVEAELPDRATNNPWSATDPDRVRVIRGEELVYLVNVDYGCVAGHCIQPDESMISLETAKHYRAVSTLAIKALLDLDEDAFRRIADDECESTEIRLTRARRRQRSR